MVLQASIHILVPHSISIHRLAKGSVECYADVMSTSVARFWARFQAERVVEHVLRRTIAHWRRCRTSYSMESRKTPSTMGVLRTLKVIRLFERI